MTLSVELTDAHAWSLAQFLKHAGLADFRSNALDEDEAYTMLDAAERVRAALAAPDTLRADRASLSQAP